jgi:ADP-heptose:LPS heptosyltransferase
LRRRTLFVLRALGLGDLLTAVPALRGLARAYPAHRRVLGAPRELAPLVRLIDLPERPGEPVFDVAPARDLAWLPSTAAGAEVAVNLHGRGPQSHHLLTRARPAELIAFRHALAWPSGPEWRADEHEVRRWCRLLRAHGAAAEPDELDLTAPGENGREPDLTLLHPGAGSPARCWPTARWAAVARAETAQHHRVLITGGPAERRVAGDIARRAGLPTTAVAAGRTDLGELARLVARAGRLACGDTGIAHLATALRTPSVVLFGPTSPATWGPPRSRPRHRALWAGRRGDPHGRSPDRGLLELTVAEVAGALRGLHA